MSKHNQSIQILPPSVTGRGEKLEDFRKQVTARGGSAVKMKVKPREFLAWCQRNGRTADTHARADYAGFLAVNLDQLHRHTG